MELAGIGPAPFAAMLLADLGADVVRIDRPSPGLTVLPPDRDLLLRGRPSVLVDLKNPRGAGVVLDLVEHADILIEGYRPGVAERLGLGPEVCWARRPALVYGRMTGWGQGGSLSSVAGHDINYIGVAGALDPIGRAGGPPQVPLNLLGDFGGGAMYLVVGILAAALEARTSGRGQVVDAAIVDGTAHLATLITAMSTHGSWSRDRGTNLIDTGAPYYDVYETSDGRWMSIGALEPQFWTEAVRALELEEVPDREDRKRWPELRAVLTAAFRRRTQAEWTALVESVDACIFPVVPLADAPQHPHLRERGTYVEHDGITQPAPAPRFSRTPATLSGPPPQPGSGTRDTLVRWGVEEVESLVADRVVVQTDVDG